MATEALGREMQARSRNYPMHSGKSANWRNTHRRVAVGGVVDVGEPEWSAMILGREIFFLRAATDGNPQMRTERGSTRVVWMW